MQNIQDQQTTRLVSRSGAFLLNRESRYRETTYQETRGTAPMVSRTQVMHADTLSAFESALLLGSFLTLAASLASLAAL